MKHVYFAGPISHDPPTAIAGKERFLVEYGDLMQKHEVNVLSPHMMYGWINKLDGFTGKGSAVEKYAMDACLQFIRRHDLDALVLLTAEGEESGGMREEKELAEELGLPYHHLPYFSTGDRSIAVRGVDRDDVIDLLDRL